ncbi:hypothetical protein VPH35_020094 [Triticum aestivum]
MSVAAGVALAVADAVWAQIKAAGHATDEHLSILDHLFGKNMLRACKILDEGGVRRVTGAPSGRSLFLVMGESKRKEEYICFPEHLCTCYSFFYDIVGRGALFISFFVGSGAIEDCSRFVNFYSTNTSVLVLITMPPWSIITGMSILSWSVRQVTASIRTILELSIIVVVGNVRVTDV